MAYGDKVWIVRNVETHLADLEDFIAGRETRIDNRIIANMCENTKGLALAQTEIYKDCAYLVDLASEIGFSNRKIKKLDKLLDTCANSEVSIIGKEGNIDIFYHNKVKISCGNEKNIHNDIALDLEAQFKHFVSKSFNLRSFAKLSNLATIFNASLKNDIVDYLKTRDHGVLPIKADFISKDSKTLSEREYRLILQAIRILLWGNCEASDSQAMANSIKVKSGDDIKGAIVDSYKNKTIKALDLLNFVIDFKTNTNKKSTNRVESLKFYVEYLENLKKELSIA